MTSTRPWALAGIVAGLAGLGTSYLTAKVLTIREAPVIAVAELVVRLTPGAVAEQAIQVLGRWDKPVLLALILLLLVVVFAVAGRRWRRAAWQSVLVWLALAGIGLLAVLLQRGAGLNDTAPLAVGLGTWLTTMAGLAAVLRREERDVAAAGAEATADEEPGRRGFLAAAGVVALVGAAAGTVGRVVGNRKRAVQESRRLLRIPGVTHREPPGRARVDLEGITPWRTPNDDFYVVDTTLAVPTLDPSEWRLRIHGMVEREVVLTYEDLVTQEMTEAWITLNCVSNPVGGPLVGNAWWSGVRTADLLARAGVREGADAVLQTSDDGWTCSTPLVALTDAREAMVAVAMNGQPLPLEHGFPARTIVPGLYGYVSACKWVVDWEVTKFSEVESYWTERGWAEQAPVKIASRIDVPSSGQTVPAGSLRVGGMAWHQHVGISSVEVALDGGPWQVVEVANPRTNKTWVQWAATLDVDPGDHVLRVRARNKAGEVQTGARRDVLPDGATGWHEVEFVAEEPEPED